MKSYNCKSIIFSSSATIYKTQKNLPLKESSDIHPINPYGKSKLFIEEVLKDFANAYGLSSMIFRYFNAAGADPNGSLGEDHDPETHLIPLVLKGLIEENGFIKILEKLYSPFYCAYRYKTEFHIRKKNFII